MKHCKRCNNNKYIVVQLRGNKLHICRKCGKRYSKTPEIFKTK